MEKFKINPKIDEVQLFTESRQEVLSVNDKYRVYFKQYTPRKHKCDG